MFRRVSLSVGVVVRLLAVLLAVSGLQVVVVATVAGTASAATVTTGTGGQFVATTGRLMAETALAANAWKTVQVDGGLSGAIPSSGVAAVQISLTAENPSTGGQLSVAADGSSSSFIALIYDSGVVGNISNTAIVPVAADGKIAIKANSATDAVIDVEGYYTSGDPAAAGYVPSPNATRIVDTRNGTGLPKTPLTANSTTTIQVSGHAGVPTGASAVYVNFEVVNPSADATIVASAYGTTTGPALTFNGSSTTSLGAVVPLSAGGAISVKYVAPAGSTINLIADVGGYFAPSDSSLAGGAQGAFTPAATRIVDNITIPGSSTQTFSVAGIAGIPVAGSGITAVALNIDVVHAGSAGGWVTTYADNATSWGAQISVATASTRSNFAAIALGPDGGIKIQNGSTDSVRVYVDVEGWYTNLSNTLVVNHQNTTQRQVNLKASTTGGGPWVTYEARLGTTGAFTPIAPSQLSDPSNNGTLTSQPVTTSGSPAAFTTYTWNVAGTVASLASGAGVSSSDALVQVEACYGQSSTDASDALVCSMPSNITYSPAGFSAANATTAVGPGTLSLLTGDYQISSTDAAISSSIDGLSIGRSLTTLAPAAANNTATGVFGPGWSADLSGPSAGRAI